MSALVQAIKSMRRDYGVVRISFTNGAPAVHIDIGDPDDGCLIGDAENVTFDRALEHLAENELFIRNVV